jgi:hypothetical protein
VLLTLPADLAALKASGVPRTLKNRFQTHENSRLRLLARQCSHKWMQALSRKNAGLPALEDDEDENGKKKTTTPQRKKQHGLGAAFLLQKQLGGVNAYNGVDEEEVAVEVQEVKIEPSKTDEEKRAERDAMIAKAQDLPQGKAAIAARKAAERAKQTVNEAMRIAEEAQRLAREAESAATFRVSKKDIISSFDDFSNAEGKKAERAKSKKRKAATATATANDDDEDDDDKPELSLDDYQARIRKQVRAYVHEQLADKRERAVVTKSECKILELKVVEKILENSSGVSDTTSAFMTSKRKEKIKSLVSAYCASTVKARGKKSRNH